MSSSINASKKSFNNEFLKKTREYIGGAIGDYFTEVMPTSSSTIVEAKATIGNLRSQFKNTTQSVFPKLKELKAQATFRNISKWYLTAGDEYDLGDGSFGDEGLDFDIPDADASQIAEVEMSENTRNSNKIASAVVSTSEKLVESQIVSTANILTALTEQNAIMTAGFNKINETLEKLLEVTTRNTAGIIEATVGAASGRTPEQDIISGGFSLDKYKKVIKKNLDSSAYAGELSMLSSMIGMLKDPNMMNPKNLISMGFGLGMDKLAPNLRAGMKSLDNAINETVTTSLIRLFEDNRYADKKDIAGNIKRLFGIDASEKRVDTSNNTLELKSVPFDSAAKEAITNAIPGYLRKILVQLGGADEVYDYRSRRFTTQRAIKAEFMNQAAMVQDNLGYASNNIRKNIDGSSQYNNAVYDLLISDLGNRVGDYDKNENANAKAKLFSGNKEAAKEYVRDLLQGTILDSDEYNDELELFVESMKKATEGMGHVDLMNQVYKRNIDRNANASAWVNSARDYGIDVSHIEDSYENDRKWIMKQYGIKDTDSDIDSARESSSGSSTRLSGSYYTNLALYEIFRRLDTGINVFRTGYKDERSDPYESLLDNLPAPEQYKPKPLKLLNSGQSSSILSSTPSTNEVPNLLTEETEQRAKLDENDNPILDENGQPVMETVKLTRGQRFARWGEQRGGALAKALVTGDTEGIKNSFSMIVRDISDVSGKAVKDGAAKINDSFGNITGYLGHTLFGSEYSYYDTDEEGNKKKVTVKANKEKGVFGVIKKHLSESFSNIKDSGKKWFESVAKYFDYGDDGDDKEGAVATKRKKFLTTSVGALAGAGLLGGPLGLLMGSIAGHAIGSANIGGKIKEMLFGRDDKGKAKGLMTRLGDSIVDPIQYQVEKTAHYAGAALKKHLIGPLSDIGYAIKERIANTAETTFGKIFKTIGKILIAPFKFLGKGLLSIAKAPITFLGDLTRATVGATGTVAEGGLGLIANLIGGKAAKEGLKERRKARNDEYDEDLNSDERFAYGPLGMFKGGFKKWRKDKHQKRADLAKELKEATKSEIAEEKTADNTTEMNKNLAELTHHATHTDGTHSIFTHDHGIHSRLDKIISFLKKDYNPEENDFPGTITTDDLKNKSGIDDIKIDKPDAKEMTTMTKRKQAKESAGKEVNDESFTNSALGAAASIVAADETVSTDEKKAMKELIKETAKPDSDPNKVTSTMISVVDNHDNSKKETTEKKNTLWDTIKSIIGGIGSGISSIIKGFSSQGFLGALAAITGLYALFKTDGAIGKVFNNIQKFIDKFLHTGDNDDDATTDGVNTALALVDAEVNNATDLANPMTNLYHTTRDGAGGKIVSQEATRAKNNYLLWTPLKMAVAKSSRASGAYANARMFGNKANRMAADARDYLEIGSSDWNNYMNKSIEAGKVSDAYNKKYSELNDEHAGSGVVKNMGKTAARLGVMTGVSSLAGGIGTHIADSMGIENSGKVGEYVSAGTTAALMLNQTKASLTGKNSVVDNILGILKKVFDFLASKFKSIGKLKTFGSNITQFFDDIYQKSVGKMTKVVAEKISAKLAAKFGEETAKNIISAATAGLPILAGAVSGIASGLCGAAYLFQVEETQVDGTMKLLASTMKGVWEALEWSPFGMILAAWDIIDGVIIKGITGKTFQQSVAEFLYNILTGDKEGKKLKAKQGAFNAQKDDYNAKYGADLDTSTFNDLVNNSGWLDKLWRGGTKTDEEGNYVFDAAGGRIDGGLKGLFVGGEKSYVMNDDGSVVKDSNGNAVVAKDKYGNTIKADDKWGDKIGRGFKAAGRFFTGGTTYKTDENGQAIWDPETQSYVVESVEKNFFGKMEDIGASIQKEHQYVDDLLNDPDGKLSQLFKIEDDPENPLNGLQKAFKIGSRVTVLPAAIVKSIGKKIGKGISGFFGKMQDIGATIQQEHQYTNDLLHDPDSKFAQLFAINDNPDDPMGGFQKALIIGSRLSVLPGAVVKSIGNRIGKTISGVASKVSNTFGTLGENIYSLDEASRTGDFSALSAVTFQEDPENPVGGFAKGIFGVSKVFHYIPTAFRWTGNMIGSGFQKLADIVGMSKDNLDTNLANIGDAVNAGDFEALSAVEYTDDPENPLNGIMKGIFSATKIINYVPTAFKWVGNRVSEGFEMLTAPIKSDFETFTSANESLGEMASNGDLSGIWNETAEFDIADPLSGIFHVSFGISRIFNSIVAIVNKIAGPIKSALEAAGQFISDIGDSIGETLGDAKDWVVDKAEGAWEGVKSGAKAAGNWIVNKAEGGWNWVKEGIGLGGDGDESETENTSSAPAAVPTSFGGSPLNKPSVISSEFQPDGRTDIAGNSNPHWGIDLAASNSSDRENTTVSSRFNGTIQEVKKDVPASDTAFQSGGSWHYTGNNSRGNYVIIKADPGQDSAHPNGFYVTNMHLKANSIPSNIKVGEKVKVGDPIGIMGSTGWSTGPHLHYEFGSDPSSGSRSTATRWDPTYSVTGSLSSGNQSSSILQTSSASPYGVSGAYQVPDFSMTSNGTTTSDGSSSGMSLTDFISKILGYAKKFLNKITGGALFADANDETSSGSISGSSDYSVGNISGSVTNTTPVADTGELTGIALAASKLDPTKLVISITNSSADNIVRLKKAGIYTLIDILSGIDYQIFLDGPPGEYHSHYSCYTDKDTVKKKDAANYGQTKNIWFTSEAWTPRPCILLDGEGRQIACATDSFGHGTFIGGQPNRNLTPWTPNPEKNPDTGEWLPGGRFCLYFKDSKSKHNGNNPPEEDYQETVQRAYELGKILLAIAKGEANAADYETTIGDTGTPTKEQVWKALKARGFSDNAVAGIMGCWEQESGNTSARIEGDYLNTEDDKFPGYANVTSSSEAMDDWVVNHLFPMYARMGKSINKKYYGPWDDGHYYPGFGLAQWTGERTMNLINYAKSVGKPWTDFNTQMQFFDGEMSSKSFVNMIPDLNSASSPSAAASIFFPKYESGGSMEGVNLRQTNAERIYNELHGTAAGGEPDSEIMEPNMEPGRGGEPDNTPRNAKVATTNTGLGGDSQITEAPTDGDSSSTTLKPTGTSSSSASITDPIVNTISTIYKKATDNSLTEIANKVWTSATTPEETSTDLSGLEAIMMQILSELRQINGNTHDSTSLLGSITENGIVDKGVRAGLSAINKAVSGKRKNQKNNSVNVTNTGIIASLARG